MPRLEHLGLAVADPEAAIRLYETLLGIRPYKSERVEREGVQTHFLAAGAVKLELLEALGPDSPVARHLTRRGEGLHHVAFEVDDIDAHLRYVREQGFTPLSEEPRPGADGKLIFFLHPKQTYGVLIEFCQRNPASPAPTRIPYQGAWLDVFERGPADHLPLVVLHRDPGAEGQGLLPLLDALESHFHLVVFDVSVADRTDAPPDLLVDLVYAVLDGLGLEHAHLFGLSRGSLAALHAALRHPHRIDSLAVHGVNPYAATRFAETQASGLSQRVLVSAVDADTALPLDAALTLHRALPNSTLAILPGTDHAATHLSPALYTPLLLQHIGVRRNNLTAPTPPPFTPPAA